MGVTVQIGDQTRDLGSVTDNWIEDQIGRRKRDNASVCVTISIQLSGATVLLATAGCPAGAGGGRAPNSLEKQIIEQWNERKLGVGEVSAGNLYSFLRHLQRII